MKVGRRGFLGALFALPFLSRLLPAVPPSPEYGTLYTHYYRDEDGGLNRLRYLITGPGNQTLLECGRVPDPGCVGARKSDAGAA